MKEKDEFLTKTVGCNSLRFMFESLRLNDSFHLGLGDIRLTVDMQIQISDIFDKYTNSDARQEFWKETSRLIQEYRDAGDERKAQGIIDCRILFNRLFV